MMWMIVPAVWVVKAFSRRCIFGMVSVMMPPVADVAERGQDGHVGQGEHRQGDELVPSGPATDLVVVEPALTFGGLK